MGSLTLVPVLVIISAFINFLDASIGMGYGTILVIVLFLIGYNPGTTVFPILFSGVIAGLLASLFHIIFKNIKIKKDEKHKVIKITSGDEEIKISMMTEEISPDTKIVIVFIIFGVISSVIGALIVSRYSMDETVQFFIKIYIAGLVLVLGILLRLHREQQHFSYKKVIAFALIAGFNKAVSGGGFGPLATSGQMLAGREGKRAIASTSLSEAIVSVVGMVTYIISDFFLAAQHVIDFGIMFSLTIGACIAVPAATFVTSKLGKKDLKRSISIGLILLSTMMLAKVFIIDMWAW